MALKDDLTKQFKDENPTITSTFNGEAILLNSEEYEITLNNWVTMRLEQIAVEESIEQAEADKAALLAKLGITADEAKLLLS
jgi:hypothetical protein